tara:strand:- start:1235 stop:1411 length:177 start_codon:yes stop_codon:yes gene_type:complete
MNRQEKKSHIDQTKSVMSLLDYFHQHLGIDTFDARIEITKIQSQITNIYHKHNDQIKK